MLVGLDFIDLWIRKSMRINLLSHRNTSLSGEEQSSFFLFSYCTHQMVMNGTNSALEWSMHSLCLYPYISELTFEIFVMCFEEWDNSFITGDVFLYWFSITKKPRMKNLSTGQIQRVKIGYFSETHHIFYMYLK